jgi:catechol 2,3-dioxygenase-like lactoylglutathione lyase family enzyme
MERILYHISLGVTDMRRARVFYEAVLTPLGCRLLYEFKDKNGEDISLGWGKTFPELWVNLPLNGRGATTANGAHVAFFAPDRSSVERFHSAALAAGSCDCSPSARVGQNWVIEEERVSGSS